MDRTVTTTSGGPDPHLGNLQKKLQLLRDDVAGVAHGYQTGMFVYGAGGVGKSWTIQEQLRAMNVPVRANTARMTGRSLFDHLRAFPEDITLVEDNEPLLRDRSAVGVLRAALWAAPRPNGGRVADRAVTWFTARGRDEFVFGGGIIMVANAQPPKTPEVEALLTRVPVTHLQVSDAELAAHMRHLAETSPPRIMEHAMTREECAEVCGFVIKESLTRNRPLDLRLLFNAYAMYVQFELGESGSHWRDRVLALINQRAPRFTRPVDVSGGTRLDRQARERELVRGILVETLVRGEQVRLWEARTGKSARTFDARKAEVKAEEDAA